MGGMKRFAEEIGALGNEYTFNLSLNDMQHILKGVPVTFITDNGSTVELKLERKK